MPATLNFRPGTERGRTQLGWLDSHHSFSFGRYVDRDNMGYRSLRVINDDIIAPGSGFGEHPHDNMEIVTWMLSGALKHGDSLGNMRVLRPGELQAMSAGTGIRHSEFNASETAPARLLQIWLLPAERDVEPRYDQRAFDAAGRHDQWQTLASGRGAAGAMPIHQDVDLRVATLSTGATLDASVADDRFAYLHVAQGAVEVDGKAMQDGDAVTFDGAQVTVKATADAQVLLFDLA